MAVFVAGTPAGLAFLQVPVVQRGHSGLTGLSARPGKERAEQSGRRAGRWVKEGRLDPDGAGVRSVAPASAIS